MIPVEFYSEDAEQSLLGAWLLGQKDPDPRRVKQNVFVRPAHQAIFEAVSDLSRQGLAPDLVTVDTSRDGESWRVLFKADVGVMMVEFAYEDLLPIGADETPWRLLTTEGVRTVEGPGGRQFLEVDDEAASFDTAPSERAAVFSAATSEPPPTSTRPCATTTGPASAPATAASRRCWRWSRAAQGSFVSMPTSARIRPISWCCRFPTAISRRSRPAGDVAVRHCRRCGSPISRSCAIRCRSIPMSSTR